MAFYSRRLTLRNVPEGRGSHAVATPRGGEREAINDPANRSRGFHLPLCGRDR